MAKANTPKIGDWLLNPDTGAPMIVRKTAIWSGKLKYGCQPVDTFIWGRGYRWFTAEELGYPEDPEQ